MTFYREHCFSANLEDIYKFFHLLFAFFSPIYSILATLLLSQVNISIVTGMILVIPVLTVITVIAHWFMNHMCVIKFFGCLQ